MKFDSKTFASWPVMLVLAFLLLWAPVVQAGDDASEDRQALSELPAAVETDLDYVLKLINNPKDSFDIARVDRLLDFSSASHDNGNKIRPSGRDSGNGIYLSLDVKAPLERILNYAYNPNIPNYVVYPSVLRLCGWYPDSDIVTGKYELWNELGRLKAPLVLRGKEFEVNTPDSFSGAYYRYDNQRLVILMRHKKGHVLISASRMIDKSQVGKKAVIIDDHNWNYFYSGISGLNLKFIGGMDTYLYNSESVIVYYQTDDARPVTTVSLYKWLDAGWAGINVVKPDHIYAGSTRFAQGLKKVMESDLLPDPATFARQIALIRSLSPAEMEAKIREYAVNFEQIAKKHEGMNKQDFADIIANGGYARVLNHEERMGVLVLESLKNFVGKPSLIKWGLAGAPGPRITLNRPGRSQGSKSAADLN